MRGINFCNFFLIRSIQEIDVFFARFNNYYFSRSKKELEKGKGETFQPESPSTVEKVFRERITKTATLTKIQFNKISFSTVFIKIRASPIFLFTLEAKPSRSTRVFAFRSQVELTLPLLRIDSLPLTK